MPASGLTFFNTIILAGEKQYFKPEEDNYLLVCGSCNRAKSWSCEHCENWLSEKSPKICIKCYWASPEDYSHIALKEIRRIDVIWSKEEVKIYEELKKKAQKNGNKLPIYVKKILKNGVNKT